MSDWNKKSWRNFPIKQQPVYEDEVELKKAHAKISSLPPLVQSHEVDNLKRLLAEVSRGDRFLLQGGDCAERFVDCESSSLDKKIKIILQMSLVLVWGAKMPVVRIGRVAGQYAKPRSNPTEKTADGKEVPVFKGDIINGFDVEDRKPDPKRLVDAYFHSAASLNYIRSRLASGFADLHRAADWDLDFVTSEIKKQEYTVILKELQNCLSFLRACGVGSEATESSTLSAVDLFSSHEGLLLEYEEALTRKSHTGAAENYNLGAHLLWIGDRTRQLDGAHVEYFRGIKNPIGLKVGPTTDKDDLVQLIKKLDPDNEPGRCVIYSRLGKGKVRDLLPSFISHCRDNGITNPVWAVDPMHGNTITVQGIKTRRFEDVMGEIIETFEVHRDMNSKCGGVHLELCGEDVTECLGGANELRADQLNDNFTSYCDPRLNYAQSMEIAFLLAKYLAGK